MVGVSVGYGKSGLATEDILLPKIFVFKKQQMVEQFILKSSSVSTKYQRSYRNR